MLEKIISFLRNLFDNQEQRQIEEYLAKSADIFELECRMKEISRKKFI